YSAQRNRQSTSQAVGLETTHLSDFILQNSPFSLNSGFRITQCMFFRGGVLCRNFRVPSPYPFQSPSPSPFHPATFSSISRRQSHPLIRFQSAVSVRPPSAVGGWQSPSAICHLLSAISNKKPLFSRGVSITSPAYSLSHNASVPHSSSYSSSPKSAPGTYSPFSHSTSAPPQSVPPLSPTQSCTTLDIPGPITTHAAHAHPHSPIAAAAFPRPTHYYTSRRAKSFASHSPIHPTRFPSSNSPMHLPFTYAPHTGLPGTCSKREWASADNRA